MNCWHYPICLQEMQYDNNAQLFMAACFNIASTNQGRTGKKREHKAYT